jgi:hypothetical protein
MPTEYLTHRSHHKPARRTVPLGAAPLPEQRDVIAAFVPHEGAGLKKARAWNGVAERFRHTRVRSAPVDAPTARRCAR